jgi:alanine racemase
LEIDLGILAENVRRIQGFVGPTTQVMGVVKANAYGHGLVPAAQAILHGGASMLGVAILEEAVRLREAGIEAPILVLGAPYPGAADEIVAAGVSQVVSCRETIEALSRAAKERGRVIGLHLKVDTGMARVGASPEEAIRLAHLILSLPSVRLEGVCTHFATSDEDAEFLTLQNEVFLQFLDWLKSYHLSPGLRHAANSGAVQSDASTHYDLVRPGLLVYGRPPLPDRKIGLRSVLQWKSRVVQARSFPAGTAVGYGLTARLERDSRLAVVPLGYADGWPRSLSNRGRVLIRGEWAAVIGRVSMDQFTVDVTDLPGITVGEEVVLVGGQGDRKQTVEEVAAEAGTNAHEILAGLSPRLPRLYYPFR